jgi:hypothetical protein
MTRIDLRYVEYHPDIDIATPLEDTVARKADPLYMSVVHYGKAFRMAHDGIMNSSHGMQLVNEGDYVFTDEQNELVHVMQPFIFEGIYKACDINVGDQLNFDIDAVLVTARVHGRTNDFERFWRKVAFITRHNNVYSCDVTCVGDKLTAEIVLNR